MHPIERLRHVARASGAPVDDLVAEAAASLATFSDDPVALVAACRRLVDRHATVGPLWWLCARTLVAADPADEVWRCRSEHHADPTLGELVHAIPDGARVAAVGWPERLAEPFARRGDVEVHVLDVEGDGPGFARLLERLDVDALDVPVVGAAAAVASSDLVVLDATAIGPDQVVAASGSWLAAAVARAAEVPVWAVGGVGRALPAGLWPSLRRRLGDADDRPWDLGVDLVPTALIDVVAGPAGVGPVPAALAGTDVPDVAELRR
ncbi:MAG: hypothetical protein KDA97_15130 [Acidimicrobiales bacterium]|nr:hypothetical protein [Acidimicrobiales bacterium]